MPNPVYDEFIQSLTAQQNLAAGKQAKTLRDLQIEDTQSKLASDMLMRQLQQMKTQADIEAFPQTQQIQEKKRGIESQGLDTQAVQQRMEYAQAQLDAGQSGHEVVREMTARGWLPEGTKASKIYDKDLGEDVWAFHNPNVPGYETPQVFNKEVIANRRKLATEKSLERQRGDVKLMVEGFEWTKDGKLRAIPGGPADPAIHKPDLKNLPMIAKLHAYRQALIDNGAPQKDIDEVQAQIDNPDTAAGIIGGIMKKRIRGEAITPGELSALDIYKTYGNPMAQMLSDAIEESGKGLPGKLARPIITNDADGITAYNNLPSGSEFIDASGNMRVKKEQ